MANQKIPDLTADASRLDTDEYVVHKSGENRAKKQTGAVLRGGLTPTTRTISTTAPLSGGGDLSANRTLAISDATTSAKGVVELATSGENAANVVVQGNDARLSDSRTPLAHNHAASEITSGTIATARLGSGTADSTTFLRGDQTYAVPAGGGSVTERWARVRKSTLQALTANTATPLTFDTEDFDTDSFHDNVTNNSRFTIPSGQGGRYQIEAAVRFATLSSGQRSVAIVKNGTVYLIGATSAGISSIDTFGNCTTIVNLAVGDYVELYAQSTVGVNALADEATHFTIRKVS